ncbi:aminoglycoside phosphotransferase family protein [Kineosporia sp. J2-2]|uniref:Aminoglycoside phosphotransferase family protein n=1 Tax=Kineosporia corallincola TaxID=2835133 RepID=A0ABS5TJS0_9ACTN|nr:aminoglycoside phosphotransferase family protein [Kineosporia corallincola]MBT0771347.1 aminoglycoside phosphotransferase family protein [Kineosporia corallincola]
MHDDEVAITEETAKGLIFQQFPAWTDLPVQLLDAIGTENTIVRIGDDLAARFPRRPTTQARLEAEARALGSLAEHVTSPRPVALGRPGPGFPQPWSVQTWLPGTPASDDETVHSSHDLARDLAALINTLREIDTQGRTFDRAGRGGDLLRHDAWVDTCLRRSAGLLDVHHLRELWTHLRDLPREAPDTMSHGDLIPGNILVSDGRFTGVLDGGGFGPADPALDLIVGWHLLDHEPRETFWAAMDVSDLDRERSQAWALEQSMGLVWYYAQTNPAMSRMGRRTLDRLMSARGR